MNTSRKRSENTPGYRAESQASASDEFGFSDIDDADLLNVADQAENDHYADIDDLENPHPFRAVHPKGRTTKRSIVTPEQNWKPTQLPNHKFACNHRCKDRDHCKHQCCREGLDKPPKKPPKWLLKSEMEDESTSNSILARSGDKTQTKLTSGGRLKGSTTHFRASGASETYLTKEPSGSTMVSSANARDWYLPHLNPTLNHIPQEMDYQFSRSPGRKSGSVEDVRLPVSQSPTQLHRGYESVYGNAPGPELYLSQTETDRPAPYPREISKSSRMARDTGDHGYLDVSPFEHDFNGTGTVFDDPSVRKLQDENNDISSYNIDHDEEDLDALMDWDPRAPSVDLSNPEASTVKAISAEILHRGHEPGNKGHASGAVDTNQFMSGPSRTVSSRSDLIRAENTHPLWKKVKHHHDGSQTANGMKVPDDAVRQVSSTPTAPHNGIEHAMLPAPSQWETSPADDEDLLMQEFGSCVDFV